MVSNTGISFSGLASGLDTDAIIRQLVAIERLPIQSLESRRSTESRRLDLVGQLGDLVQSLQEKADALSTPAEFYAYSATVSDETKATVTAGTNAQPGTHTIDIQRLAATDRWAFDAVSSRDENLTSEAGEQISFRVGTTDYTLTVDPDDSSLEDLASQIEAMAPDDISASVVNTGTESSPSYQLVIASTESGEENRITDIFSNVGQTGSVSTSPLTIAYTAPDGSGNATSSNNVTVGNDALAEINGLLVRRADNSFSDVIEGVTIDVNATTDGDPLQVTIDPDREAVRGRVDEFVTAYNDVVEFINQQSTFTPGEGDDSGTTGGLLFGDSLLGSVRRSLRSALFNVDLDSVTSDTDGFSTLSLVGIEQDSSGLLSVNSTTFDEKFTENIDALMDLFADTDGFDNGGAEDNTPESLVDTTADSGLMANLSRAIDQMFGNIGTTSTGENVSGLFDARQDAIRDSIDRYDTQIERREERLESYEQRLILQYAGLEELMASLNAQGAALNGALAG
ncbi:MAG: flagellar filament capping protein FliD [Planctomycetota bacterium]